MTRLPASSTVLFGGHLAVPNRGGYGLQAMSLRAVSSTLVRGDRLDVLIVGAGISGSALATLLGRLGHAVTVVERDQRIRSSGNPVDVRGPAYDVVDRLGLIGELQAHATSVNRVVFVGRDGRRRAGLRTQRDPSRALEVARADLARVLTRAAQQVGDIRFDDTVTSISGSDSGVDVDFERAAPARFDIVVGADGLHSTIRTLVFGPEQHYVSPLGMYVATVQLEAGLRPVDATTVLVHNEPGTATSLHPGSTRPIAAFIFRSPALIPPRDRDCATELLRNTYAGTGWRDAELLEAYSGAADTYFDRVSRVRVPAWSRDRVVLLGDAASCTSLFGEGSSNAVLGAARLARALSSTRNVTEALYGYEREHRRTITRSQRLIPLMSHLLVPSSAGGLTARNFLFRRS